VCSRIRLPSLSTVGFVIVFSSFLLRCVDYGALAARSGLGEQWALDEILVPRCASSCVPLETPALEALCSSRLTLLIANLRASFGAWVLFLLFLSVYAYQLASFARSIPRLFALHRFFAFLLNMRDEDIQTTNWNDVVRAIEGIREANSATSVRAGAIRLDAHESVSGRDGYPLTSVRQARAETDMLVLSSRPVPSRPALARPASPTVLCGRRTT
jgi:autophagy-related protein 9